MASAARIAMNPKTEGLKVRTKKFALDVLDFAETLPTRGPAARVADQLLRAATSVGANYRAGCRARSKAEFAAKIGLVLEEADESLFWLELADARSIGETGRRAALLQEAGELTAIFAASCITARASIGAVQR
jgi:four helix bundle protein